VPITRINYQKYFSTTPGFDSHCTAAARYMGKFWPQAYHTVMSAYLWLGHPPFILYARDIDGHFDYSAADDAKVLQNLGRMKEFDVQKWVDDSYVRKAFAEGEAAHSQRDAAHRAWAQGLT